MDTLLLSRLPNEQARCREIARHFNAMGSIGCFAAALIEQTLQRADRAIIDGGGEDAIRGVLDDLRAFNMTRQGATQMLATDRPVANSARFAIEVLPVGRRAGRVGRAQAA